MGGLSYTLISAIRRGKLELVREIIDERGLYYSTEWSGGYTLLVDAIQYKQVEVVKFLLEAGAKVRSNNNAEYEDTPLHYAVSEGNLDIVKALLDKGLDIDAQNEEKQTPLCRAILEGNERMVRLLLKRGASTCSEDIVGDFPLHIASYSQQHSKNLDIVELLIDYGSDVNCLRSKSSDTPLHIAVKKGNRKLASLLVKGAHLEAKNSSGFTPLHCAIQSGNQKVTKLLLNRKANVVAHSKDGSTPLHIAVEKSDEELICLLLDEGADLEATNTSGSTPFHCAVQGNNLEVTKLLLDRKANVDARFKNGDTPLHVALKRRSETIARMLLEYGADVNTCDKDDKTPLYLAVTNNLTLSMIETLLNYHPDASDKSALRAAILDIGCRHRGVVVPLIEHEFNFDHEDTADLELLHTAVKRGYVEAVKCLLNHGADLNIVSYGCTLFCPAIRFGREEMVNLLISHGLNPNSRCQYHDIPISYSISMKNAQIMKTLLTNGVYVQDKPELLHLAISRSWSEGCKILLKQGVNVNACDRDHLTPLHLAVRQSSVRQSSVRLVETLLEHSGLHMDLIDNHGDTALHIACLNDSHHIVTILLENESNLNIRNREGETPLDVAIRTRNFVAPLRTQNGVKNRQSAAQSIIMHMAKVQFAGLHLSDKDLEIRSGDDLQALFHDSSELCAFYMDCKEELNCMKDRWLATNISLLDISTINNPGYILNETLDTWHHSTMSNCLSMEIS